MVAQSLHRGFYVGKVCRPVVGMFRVARHPELRPYEQPHLVAELIEIVRFGNAATPETYEVYARLTGVSQFGIHALIVASQHGLGYPVGAAYKNSLAVDVELS